MKSIQDAYRPTDEIVVFYISYFQINFNLESVGSAGWVFCNEHYSRREREVQHIRILTEGDLERRAHARTHSDSVVQKKIVIKTKI